MKVLEMSPEHQLLNAILWGKVLSVKCVLAVKPADVSTARTESAASTTKAAIQHTSSSRSTESAPETASQLTTASQSTISAPEMDSQLTILSQTTELAAELPGADTVDVEPVSSSSDTASAAEGRESMVTTQQTLPQTLLSRQRPRAPAVSVIYTVAV